LSTGYQIKNQEGLYYLTMTIVDWVDIFTRPVYRDIVIESLGYCISTKGLEIFGFVLMSNHLHLIAQSETGNLSGIIRDFKKFTSKKIIEAIQSVNESRKHWILHRFGYNASEHAGNKEYQVWMHRNHAEYLYSPDFIREKLDYLHNNPVRAAIVEKPEEYLYSSARFYAGLGCLVSISDLGLPWRTVK